MWQLMLGSALMGAAKARRQEEQQKQYNLGQAEQTRYSPWTGVAGKADNSYVPTMMEGAFAGGVQGAGMSQALGAAGFGGAAGAAGAANVDPTQMQYAGANTLGGQDMAAQLGQGMQMQPGGAMPLQFASLQQPSLYRPY